MSHHLSQTGSSSYAATATATLDSGVTGPQSMKTDEELVLEYAKTGNRLAFEDLVHRFERELYGYLRSYLGDAHLAEDAFQATFLQLHLKCHQFQPGRRLRPWLYAIAGNQATDLMRRNRRHKAVSLSTTEQYDGSGGEQNSLGDLLQAADVGPSEQLVSAEESEETRLAVESIPAKLRQMLDLVVYQGLKYREAADVLGIPLGTVKSRMNKAYQTLHEALIAAGHAASSEISGPLRLAK
jgi:RNA polymerase sigma-70 factor, ECF subfamily